MRTTTQCQIICTEPKEVDTAEQLYSIPILRKMCTKHSWFWLTPNHVLYLGPQNPWCLVLILLDLGWDIQGIKKCRFAQGILHRPDHAMSEYFWLNRRDRNGLNNLYCQIFWLHIRDLIKHLSREPAHATSEDLVLNQRDRYKLNNLYHQIFWVHVRDFIKNLLLKILNIRNRMQTDQSKTVF